MNQPDRPTENTRKQSVINLTLAVIAGQVGCATLVIILAAVFGGLWLDARMNSKPTFTIILLVASIPVSVIVMLVLARAAISKMKAGTQQGKQPRQEEED